jgi:translation initiation factor 2 gamma subunit (eIF-2gamma)
MYTKIETAFPGGIVAVAGAVDPTLRTGDTDVWSGILRVQRNFWP